MTLTYFFHLNDLAILDHFVRLSPFMSHYTTYGYKTCTQ